jgi:hypothetical protein
MGQLAIEICLDERGIRVVRTHSATWDEASRAEALLEAVRPILRQLDEVIKSRKVGEMPEGAVQ